MSDKTIWKRLMDIDFRIIATILIVIIGTMLVYPIRIPFPISSFTRQYYNFIDDIPAGETIMFIMGDVVTTRPQLEAATCLTMYMLLENGVKIIALNPGTESYQMFPDYMARIEGYLGRKIEYGVEFVWLGYVPGGESNTAALFESIREVTNNQDNYGTSLDDIPIMEGIDNGFDFNYVLGNSGAQNYEPMWMRQIVLPYNVKFATVARLGSVASLQLYLATGQLKAISGGLLGSAEMEFMTGHLGLAFGQVIAVSLAGLFFVILVIFGNVFYFLDRLGAGGDQQ
jgi:hypothetical protein